MRGYKNVIDKGIELNDSGETCELMMETSGHGALRQNRFLDDGAFMAVKIIIEAARRRWQGEAGVRCAICVWLQAALCEWAGVHSCSDCAGIARGLTRHRCDHGTL